MYSTKYGYQQDETNKTIGQIYMVIGLGSIIFFLFGVCALCCCCRSRFRGMERKGFVIGAGETREALLSPAAPGYSPAVNSNAYPVQVPQFSPAIAPPQVPESYPQSAPHQVPLSYPESAPPYDMPPKY